jgi:hypothetical protein
MMYSGRKDTKDTSKKVTPSLPSPILKNENGGGRFSLFPILKNENGGGKPFQCKHFEK